MWVRSRWLRGIISWGRMCSLHGCRRAQSLGRGAHWGRGSHHTISRQQTIFVSKMTDGDWKFWVSVCLGQDWIVHFILYLWAEALPWAWQALAALWCLWAPLRRYRRLRGKFKEFHFIYCSFPLSPFWWSWWMMLPFFIIPLGILQQGRWQYQTEVGKYVRVGNEKK